MTWELMDSTNREAVNAMTAPARTILSRDRRGLLELAVGHGYGPAPQSRWEADTLDIRWMNHGRESLFLSTSHRLGHRLMMIDNLLEALDRLLHDHAPVFSPYPTVRTVVLAAARIHAVISPDKVEDRAAQALHDWIYSIDQQRKRALSIGTDDELIATARDRESRRQAVANGYGYAIRGDDLRHLKDPGKRRIGRTTDAEAITNLMRPDFVDLEDADDRGLGPAAWSLLSAFVHADPIQLLDHLSVTEASDLDDPRVRTSVATQVHGRRIGLLAFFAHKAVGDLCNALHRSWGWTLGSWSTEHRSGTNELLTRYIEDPSTQDPVHVG